LTQKKQTQEQNGFDKIDVTNRAHDIATTNHSWLLKEGKGKRRLMYFATDKTNASHEVLLQALCEPWKLWRSRENESCLFKFALGRLGFAYDVSCRSDRKKPYGNLIKDLLFESNMSHWSTGRLKPMWPFWGLFLGVSLIDQW
jgi:hypothetical protein